MRLSRKYIIYIVIALVVVGASAGIMAYKVSVDRHLAMDHIKNNVGEVGKKLAAFNNKNLVVGIKGDENTLVKEGEEYIESGAYGIDKRFGPVTEFKTEGTVDTAKPGDYKVTYTFKSHGATNSITRKITVVPADKFQAASSEGIPVFAYHYVCKDNETKADNNKFCIKEGAFEAQMKYLHERGCYYPSYKELRAYLDGKHSIPANSVIITFDDGGEDVFQNALPILEKYKIPATEFMIGNIDTPRLVKQYPSRYMAFENHSYGMHWQDDKKNPPIIKASEAEMKEDFEKNVKLIGNNDAFAYPYGAYTAAAVDVLKSMDTTCAFIFKPGKAVPGVNPYLIRRQIIYNRHSLQDFINML